MRSIRFFSRARTSSQRGFALIAAIVLAVLYFALIELLLIDASRELREARRFRARIVAATLAENGAELAALGMVTMRSPDPVSAEDWQGTISGEINRSGPAFDLIGRAETKGLERSVATVQVFGRIVDDDEIRIQYTMHTP